ncbi:MAG: polysaccharide biosynthesis C-terminal domain-containing protein, partial [Bacteroidota bacterium]
LAGLLLPMYARLYAQKESLLPLLHFSVQLLLAGSLCAAIPLVVYSQEVVDLLYDFADQRTGAILFFLALTFIAQCLNYAYGALLSGTGFIGRMNKIYALGIILNFGGNLLVLPRYGATGAAAITLLTQAFIAVTQAILAHRWLALPAGGIAWFRILLLFTLLASCGLALQHFNPLPNLSWIIQAVLLGSIGLGAALMLRLIALDKLFELAKPAEA